jgi:hypothetical protein
MDVTDWRKSSYSGGNGGECVEVASADAVVVRDSKQAGQHTRVMLAVPASAWRRFTRELKQSL